MLLFKQVALSIHVCIRSYLKTPPKTARINCLKGTIVGDSQQGCLVAELFFDLREVSHAGPLVAIIASSHSKSITIALVE